MSDNGSALPRLMERYRSEIKSRLYEKFNYQNLAQVPRLFSVTLNVGLGEALQNARLLEAASEELKIISGQKPVITKARKSVANFRLREGQSIGCMVTLRSRRMYEFMARLSMSRCPGCGIFGAFLLAPSMDGVTTRWASASRSSSRKSIPTRASGFAA